VTTEQTYTITDAWLAEHDRALANSFLEAFNTQVMPKVAQGYAQAGAQAVANRIAKAYAQAGADAMMAYLAKRGRLLPEGKPLKIKTVVRNDAGAITAVIDEDVVAHERAGR
jgi:hypothetical protein